MIAHYEVTGKELERLVETIDDIVQSGIYSCGAPTYGYKVDTYFISSKGDLYIWDRSDSEEVEHILEALDAAGFTARPDNPIPEFEDLADLPPNGGVIRIYWDDLLPHKQAEIIAAYGDNCNYDVFPIVEIPLPDEDNENGGEAE
ncbi:hypothetical protein [Enterocloster clostridioformis]|uniref:hypothetical protein n=1 Tax=Enterocloster clostridioformis TaxID=1531 RepID=UPI0008EB455F|nr:hypothetical protein [Enterocloster clostridioformis]SFG86484.1 hypothetical protein SAMN05660211_04182 [Enterocloster clostridioformis]